MWKKLLDWFKPKLKPLPPTPTPPPEPEPTPPTPGEDKLPTHIPFQLD